MTNTKIVKEHRAACRELWWKGIFSFIILWAAQRGHSFTTCLLWVELMFQSSPLDSFYMEVSFVQLHSWTSPQRQALNSENQSESPRIWRQGVEIDSTFRTETKIKHMMAIMGENHWVYPYSKKEPILKSNKISMCGTKISTDYDPIWEIAS